MMKIKQVLIAVVTGGCLLGMGFWFGTATAGTSDPGSAADPLVSKSYVDGLMLFQVVNVPKDQTLVGEGGTEIVLRAGTATVIASANGGVLDVSDGVDMPQGAAIKMNHLLVTPRTDGRGLAAKTDVVAMVKGAYSVKPASK